MADAHLRDRRRRRFRLARSRYRTAVRARPVQATAWSVYSHRSAARRAFSCIT